MTAIQLNRASDVLQVWPFFQEGFTHMANEYRYYFNNNEEQKRICNWAVSPAAFVCLTCDDLGDPTAFATMYETTLPYSSYRSFTNHGLYYRKGHSASVPLMMGLFDQFCKLKNIRHYTVNARRSTLGAKRCFSHAQFGFKKISLTFEKFL
jgi:hypothetical protein